MRRLFFQLSIFATVFLAFTFNSPGLINTSVFFAWFISCLLFLTLLMSLNSEFLSQLKERKKAAGNSFRAITGIARYLTPMVFIYHGYSLTGAVFFLAVLLTNLLFSTFEISE